MVRNAMVDAPRARHLSFRANVDDDAYRCTALLSGLALAVPWEQSRCRSVRIVILAHRQPCSEPVTEALRCLVSVLMTTTTIEELSIDHPNGFLPVHPSPSVRKIVVNGISGSTYNPSGFLLHALQSMDDVDLSIHCPARIFTQFLDSLQRHTMLNGGVCRVSNLSLRLTDTTIPGPVLTRLWERIVTLPHLRRLCLGVDRNPVGALMLQLSSSSHTLRRLQLGLQQTNLSTTEFVRRCLPLPMQLPTLEVLDLDVAHNDIRLPVRLCHWTGGPALKRMRVDVSGNPFNDTNMEHGCHPQWLTLVHVQSRRPTDDDDDGCVWQG